MAASHAPIEWTRGPQITDQARAFFTRSYDGHDSIKRYASWSLDRDPTGAIQGVFKCISSGSIRSVHLRSDGHDLTLPFWIDAFNLDRWCGLNASIGRFSPIRPINRRVLRRCMYLSWISIKLTCLDTNPLVFLDSILSLSQFRIHRGVEIKIWWKIEREIAAWSSPWRSWCFRWLIVLITSFRSLNRFSGSSFS